MGDVKEDSRVAHQQYKLVPPDGGWGYVILMSVSVYHAIISLPATSFGLIYGKFLASIGDETSQTGLASGMYFSCQMFSGCVTNFLLRKYSYRKVGIIGSVVYFMGAVGLVFAQNFTHLIICFGIMQGVGAGFMLGAVYCTFTSYFKKRLHLMMGIVQITNAVGIMIMPSIAAVMIKNLEFTNTLIVLVGLSLVNIANMTTLVPVKRHMKKVYIEVENGIPQQKNEVKEQVELLLKKENGRLELDECKSNSNSSPAKLIENVNDRHTRSIPFMDLDLLKTAKFWNISVGRSATFLADVSFFALIPVLLRSIGFETSEIAFMMTVSFGCDLVARLIYAASSKFFQPKSRYVFLTSSALMAIFRTVFVLNDSYMWRIVTLGMIGGARSLMANTQILVIADEYKEKFPSAFTLNMIANGTASLIYGGLGSFIKTSTGKDEMVVYLFTAGNLLCVICWSTELIYTRLKYKSIDELRD